jgi:predicted 3-demethylubiquinone-9 3-methyltransferase (glyoxalase superfamily)
MTQSQKIIPCLWFDSNAEEAAAFYASLFADSHIGKTLLHSEEGRKMNGKPPGSVMTVDFTLAGFRFTGLNGGPLFAFTPAISFYVTCESEAEIDLLWAKLSEGGVALMPLANYDWSEKYGWVQDRFGLTWQLALGKVANVGQKVLPFLMFGGSQHGHAEEALNLYTHIFPNSAVDGILRTGEGAAATVQHAQFSLDGEKFMVIDGGPSHAFTFTEGISLQVMCATQAEVDHYWHSLIADGGEEGPCGWLKDKFGVSWQVTPSVLYDMLHDPDPARTQRVNQAVFQMQKLDIDMLQRAYTGTEM